MNKQEAIEHAIAGVHSLFSNGPLHPTDEAEAFREIEKWAGKRAQVREDRNADLGVPDR